jgi:hypothetical protein
LQMLRLRREAGKTGEYDAPEEREEGLRVSGERGKKEARERRY